MIKKITALILLAAPLSDCSRQHHPETQGELRTIQTGFSFTEGPAVDHQGNVFFTDQPNDIIYKWEAATDKVSPFLTPSGRANGLAFDRAGYLIACADRYGEIWKIGPDGSHEVLADNYDGKRLNGPNDVWINPVTDGLYITDPMFPRDYWAENDPRKQGWPPTHSEQEKTGKGGHVYYLAPGSHTLVRVSTQPDWDADSWPNGITGTPDGKKLYVNKWQPDNLGGTFEFDIKADGTLSNMKKCIAMGAMECRWMNLETFISATGWALQLSAVMVEKYCISIPVGERPTMFLPEPMAKHYSLPDPPTG